MGKADGRGENERTKKHDSLICLMSSVRLVRFECLARLARLARLAIDAQSILCVGARHRARAARSVQHPRTSPQPRGDRRVWRLVFFVGVVLFRAATIGDLLTVIFVAAAVRVVAEASITAVSSLTIHTMRGGVVV